MRSNSRRQAQNATQPPHTHNPVAVDVSYILVGGMTARYRRDAVPAGFCTGDPAVVVVHFQSIVALGSATALEPALVFSQRAISF